MEHPVDAPRLLVASQPNTAGQSHLPMVSLEVRKVLQHFELAEWPQDVIAWLDKSDATVEEVSRALDGCSWAHFACHGVQDFGDAMKSSFLLHDGSLGMSEIASKRLTRGRFAFLSCCQAAVGMEQLPGEAMHLAAALQFAGFPSVIATLWSIMDEDAPVVAEEVYRYLFREKRKKIPDVTEAAAALNFAVRALRRNRKVTVNRWAAFMHTGV